MDSEASETLAAGSQPGPSLAGSSESQGLQQSIDQNSTDTATDTTSPSGVHATSKACAADIADAKPSQLSDSVSSHQHPQQTELSQRMRNETACEQQHAVPAPGAQGQRAAEQGQPHGHVAMPPLPSATQQAAAVEDDASITDEDDVALLADMHGFASALGCDWQVSPALHPVISAAAELCKVTPCFLPLLYHTACQFHPICWNSTLAKLTRHAGLIISKCGSADSTERHIGWHSLMHVSLVMFCVLEFPCQPEQHTRGCTWLIHQQDTHVRQTLLTFQPTSSQCNCACRYKDQVWYHWALCLCLGLISPLSPAWQTSGQVMQTALKHTSITQTVVGLPSQPGASHMTLSWTLMMS